MSDQTNEQKVQTPDGKIHTVDLCDPQAISRLLSLGVNLQQLKEFGFIEDTEVCHEIINEPPEDLSQSATLPPSPSSPEAAATPPVTVTPPPRQPINRWGSEKPNLTYNQLVTLILKDLPNYRGTLKDIYRDDVFDGILFLKK